MPRVDGIDVARNTVDTSDTNIQRIRRALELIFGDSVTLDDATDHEDE